MIKSEQLQIEDLFKRRKEILDNYNKTWDEEKLVYTGKYPDEADKLRSEIYDKLKNWQDLLPVEFIIEQLTHLGFAPSLLYDDNGNFSLSGNGFQTISSDENPIDMEMTFFVEINSWFPTIREAIKHYFDD